MKRPLFCLAFAFFIGVVVALCLAQTLFDTIRIYWIWVVGCAVVCFGLVCSKPVRWVGAMLLASLVGALYVQGYTAFFVQPVQMLSGQTLIDLTAQVIAYPKASAKGQLVEVAFGQEQFRNKRIHQPVRTVLPIPKNRKDVKPGDVISGNFYFYKAGYQDGMDWEQYNQSQGMWIRARQTKPLQWQPASKVPSRFWAKQLGQRLQTQLFHLLPKREAGVALAILTGQTGEMHWKDKELLRKIGLAHVTAVSGMHIGFLVVFCLLAFGRKYGMIFSLFLVLGFAMMAGWTPSVMRASLMYGFTCLAFYTGREKDMPTVWMLTLTVLTLCNPYSVQGVGLQLSFAATLGILLLAGRMAKGLCNMVQRYPPWIQKGVQWFAMGLSVSISASMFTVPILLYHFGKVSLLAPFSSLLGSVLVGGIFLIGLFGGMLTMVLPFLIVPVQMGLHWLCALFLDGAERMGQIPYTVLTIEQGWGTASLVCLYAGVLVCLFVRRRTFGKVLGGVCMVGAVGLYSMCWIQDAQITQVVVFPSGSGNAVLVHRGRGLCALIDAGESSEQDLSRQVGTYLLWHDIPKISAVVLTSVDKTHTKGYDALIRQVPVDTLLVPRQNRQPRRLQHLVSLSQGKQIVIQKVEGQAWKEMLSGLPVQIASVVPRKLAVQIGEQSVLILHSLTEKMLATWMQREPMHADIIVIAEQLVSSEKQLQNLLTQLQPHQVVMQAHMLDSDQLFRKYPVHNTKMDGIFTYSIHQ